MRRTSAALEDSKPPAREPPTRSSSRANQAKANFLSIISHELKTPLSVINGFLSLILDERYQNDPRHLREAVQISKRRGEQLSRMIDELIDLSRLDARSMVLRLRGDRRRRDAARARRRVPARSSAAAACASRCGCRADLPRLVCDPDKLRQVFTNLLGNAIKFSPDGGEVELGAEDRGDGDRLLAAATPASASRPRSWRRSSRSSTRSTPRRRGASAGPGSA